MVQRQKRTNIYKIGITGNICSGKSLVRNTLRKFGVNTLDAEDLALNMLADNPQRFDLRLTELGNGIIDSRGRLSRRKLTSILYTNPEKKAFFDEKVNPVLREEIKRFLYSPIGSQIRAVEAPMLLETDTKHLYDEVWVVTATGEKQVERLVTRDHLTVAEARHLIDTQWPQDKKVALSDRVIDNTGEIQHTESQVRRVLDDVKNRAFKIGI